MVSHTQTVRWQQPTNCFSVFDHFMGLVLKGLTPKMDLFVKMIIDAAQKRIFSHEDFFSKCDQIRRELQIWSHLPKKSLRLKKLT